MVKTNITVSVDYDTIKEHRQLGSNISKLCNDALINALNRPTIERLKESIEQSESKKNDLIKELEGVEGVEKDAKLVELGVVGKDYLVGQKELFEEDYKALKRMLLRCSTNLSIPRETFDKALESKAKKQGITATELANKVFTGGIYQIDQVFKEREQK